MASDGARQADPQHHRAGAGHLAAPTCPPHEGLAGWLQRHPMAAATATSVATGAAWLLLTKVDHHYTAPAGVVVGALIGLSVAGVDRSTRLPRGALAVVWTTITLFFVVYFVARYELTQVLDSQQIGAELRTQVFVSVPFTFRIVFDHLFRNAFLYVVWAAAVYAAWLFSGCMIGRGARPR